MAAVARDLGVGWLTVMEAVREFGEPLVTEQLGSLAGVRSLGMGEHRWRSPLIGGRRGSPDLETGQLLEVVQGPLRGCCQGFIGV